MLARQALHHLNNASRPFCSDYFGNKVSLYAQASLNLNSPILSFPLYLE
jgi:hypothetical protein